MDTRKSRELILNHKCLKTCDDVNGSIGLVRVEDAEFPSYLTITENCKNNYNIIK